jgi:hypothetical protein
VNEPARTTKDHDHAPTGQAGLKAPRAAGVAGLVFAVLFTASLLLTRPPAGGSAASLASWYSGGAESTIAIVGLYLIPFAGISFLWFIGVLRNRIGHREDRLFATVFLGSGLLFVAMLFAAAATASALALQSDAAGSALARDPGLVGLTQALTYAFMFVYAARTAGVFVIVTSTIAVRTRTAPKWVAALGYAVAAVLLLSIRDFQLVILLFPAWVVLLSVCILITPQGADANEERSGDALQAADAELPL